MDILDKVSLAALILAGSVAAWTAIHAVFVKRRSVHEVFGLAKPDGTKQSVGTALAAECARCAPLLYIPGASVLVLGLAVNGAISGAALTILTSAASLHALSTTPTRDSSFIGRAPITFAVPVAILAVGVARYSALKIPLW